MLGCFTVLFLFSSGAVQEEVPGSRPHIPTQANELSQAYKYVLSQQNLLQDFRGVHGGGDFRAVREVQLRKCLLSPRQLLTLDNNKRSQ